MLRKLVIGFILAMIVSVVAGGFTSGATTRCRRVTVTIFDTPYFGHPICTNLPTPLDQYGQNTSPVDQVLPNVDVNVPAPGVPGA